ncbi:MAG: DNA-3-methyladenine glycosylase [Candidatus Saccharibacteria bacterium]
MELTNGPAKTCQAFAIDKTWNGHDMHKSPLKLIVHPAIPASAIVRTVRLGITQARDVPWRFYIKDNPYVSKP